MPHSATPIDVVSRARDFAIAAHGQQRYGDQPYVVHLDAVAKLAAPYGEDAQTVAYLHDAVEDTAVTLDQVRALFSEHVAQCVALLTDERGGNRAERKLRTHAKLAQVSGASQLALIVKAADRLANLQMSSRVKGDPKLEMYRREHPAFRMAAFRPSLCDDLWAQMERILSP
jgi:(p)ppGpp synthase/HD superfamily hydrolase